VRTFSTTFLLLVRLIAPREVQVHSANGSVLPPHIMLCLSLSWMATYESGLPSPMATAWCSERVLPGRNKVARARRLRTPGPAGWGPSQCPRLRGLLLYLSEPQHHLFLVIVAPEIDIGVDYQRRHAEMFWIDPQIGEDIKTDQVNHERRRVAGERPAVSERMLQWGSLALGASHEATWLRVLFLACVLPLSMGFSSPSVARLLTRGAGGIPPAAQSQRRLATRAPGVRTLVAAAAERSTIELPTGLSMEYFEVQPAAGRSQNLGPAAQPSL